MFTCHSYAFRLHRPHMNAFTEGTRMLPAAI